MADKLTDLQLMALADLADGKWKYGISIRGRHSLPSLRKRDLVVQHYGNKDGIGSGADQWGITTKGKEALSRLGTIRHLPVSVGNSQVSGGDNG